MDDLPESAPMGNRRSIPRTDLLLADPRIQAAEERLGRPLVKAAIVRAQERARKAEFRRRTADELRNARQHLGEPHPQFSSARLVDHGVEIKTRGTFPMAAAAGLFGAGFDGIEATFKSVLSKVGISSPVPF